MRQYKGGLQYISETQLAKIENTLHTLGKEIAAVKLV
jgi:hypothetical protein